MPTRRAINALMQSRLMHGWKTYRFKIKHNSLKTKTFQPKTMINSRPSDHSYQSSASEDISLLKSHVTAPSSGEGESIQDSLNSKAQ